LQKKGAKSRKVAKERSKKLNSCKREEKKVEQLKKRGAKSRTGEVGKGKKFAN